MSTLVVIEYCSTNCNHMFLELKRFSSEIMNHVYNLFDCHCTINSKKKQLEENRTFTIQCFLPALICLQREARELGARVSTRSCSNAHVPHKGGRRTGPSMSRQQGGDTALNRLGFLLSVILPIVFTRLFLSFCIDLHFDSGPEEYVLTIFLQCKTIPA